MATRKTGYLHKYEGGAWADKGKPWAPFETWHRTLEGACKARHKKQKGTIYRITGDDSTEEVRLA